MESNSTQVFQKRRMSVEATVIHGCPTCRAPGVWKSEKDPDVDKYQSWPKIILLANDPMIGQPVGDICPNCGSNRLADTPHGEIYVKEVILQGNETVTRKEQS